MEELGDALVDEPQGDLLGQRSHGELLGPSQDSQRAWAPIYHPSTSPASRDELDRFLQSPQTTFITGRPQSNAIRETLVHGTA